MKNELNGLEFLQKLKARKDANDKGGLITDLSQLEISFLKKLMPSRYPEEPFELYKWRQKIQKQVAKYVMFKPNQVDYRGKSIPRKKEEGV